METHDNDISPLVRKWMPHATDDELREATFNFREYLKVVRGISLRIRAEEEIAHPKRDKSDRIDMMD